MGRSWGMTVPQYSDGLLYIPAAMARKDDSIPAGRIQRTAKVGQAIGSSGARYAGTRARNVVRSKDAASAELEKRHLETAEKMVDALGQLKGAAMKIGQLASFIDTEFLPPEYRELYQEKLADLRTSAPPMPWKKVRDVLEEEWDEDPEELFEDFEHEAAAAASIGQVDRDRFGEIVYRFCFGSIYHLQHFNADAHPGNYVWMEDGRVAFLDFGMTKQLDHEQIELEVVAIRAVLDDDPERLRTALADLGFLSKPKRVEAERLMEHVKAVGGWYLDDQEVTIDSEYVMNVMTAVTDPRSEFYSLMRRENLPANELMGRRLEFGVLAVLGQLQAECNWLAIGSEWWFGSEPATELGREEWEYFESRGERRERRYSSRGT